MPATAYRLYAWGDPVGGGTMGAVHVGVAAIAKPGNGQQPYAVANEVFCGVLARALHLPAPPVVVAEREGVLHSISLNFNLSGVDLPPADCEALVLAHPALAAGIVLFDEWTLNHDRHSENISFDEDEDRVQIFDHGHAFRPAGLGTDWLETRRGRTALSWPDEHGVLRITHCLVPHLRSLDPMTGWHERMMQVPEYTIREAVRAGCNLGWPDSDYDFCVDFLLERRATLLDVIGRQRHLFTSVPEDLPLPGVGINAAPAGETPRTPARYTYLRRRMRLRYRRNAEPGTPEESASLTEGTSDGG
jgi:hypothetical protein